MTSLMPLLCLRILEVVIVIAIYKARTRLGNGHGQRAMWIAMYIRGQNAVDANGQLVQVALHDNNNQPIPVDPAIHHRPVRNVSFGGVQLFGGNRPGYPLAQAEALGTPLVHIAQANAANDHLLVVPAEVLHRYCTLPANDPRRQRQFVLNLMEFRERLMEFLQNVE